MYLCYDAKRCDASIDSEFAILELHSPTGDLPTEGMCGVVSVSSRTVWNRPRRKVRAWLG